MTGLYQTIRPTTLDGVVGQPAAVAQLASMVNQGNVSHAILFSGPSGTGKTTLARILARLLGSDGLEIQEINCASNNGVDLVRDIEAKIPLRTLSGKPRVYIIDECHQLTQQAQRAFLKVLEDTPPHVYFFLATTNPEKLDKPLKSRCTPVSLGLVPTTVIKAYLKGLEAHNGGLPDKTLMAIAEAAAGSVRRALVFLEQTVSAGVEHLPSILGADAEVSTELFDIVRAVYAGSAFPKFSDDVRGLDDNQIESFRRAVLGYGAAILLRGAKSTKATESVESVMDLFSRPFFESGKSGLILAIHRSQKVF